jgi:hypothetical protein
MQTQETLPASMTTAYREWRQSTSLDFLDGIPDSLLHYVFCVGWVEKEKQSLGSFEDDIMNQINKIFKH